MEIELREISFSDKIMVNEIRKKYNHVTASHAFQSLYIWKDDMKLGIYSEEDFFVVKSDLEGSNEWFFPCGSDEKKKAFIDSVDKDNLVFRYMRQEDVDFLENNYSGIFEISEFSGDDEYLYSVSEQIELKGKKLRTVRNHISRVQRDHELRYEGFNEENIVDVMKVCDSWERKSTETCNLQDMTASDHLLKYKDELDVMGVLVWVDEVPYAVVAGYPLSDDTFDMAMAKQVDTLSGLTTYAKYAMYNTLPEQYTIVNAEEDLGISGLRIMKQQMGPIGKNLMYGAKIK